MFEDYPFLKWYLNNLSLRPIVKRNNLHKHLEWILKMGECIRPTMPCPQCAWKSGVCFFLALGSEREGYTIGPRQTSCERQECRDNLEGMRRDSGEDKIHKIRFSSVMFFQNKTDQRRVYDLLVAAFELTRPLTAEKVFLLFSKKQDESPAPL